MSEKYDHKKIEKKWQAVWEASGQYTAQENSSKPKKYILDMFPYPSGEGLHVGHPKGYIATDIYSRMMRMQGFNVLHPMGWDAFGLPAEQYAIKNKVHPSAAVAKNVARYKEQLSIIGFDYDWTREINTTDPAYYQWTQWIFLKMFEKGLAYESYEPINWCPSCQTGLANEDLEDGRCERCGTLVEKRPMRQWVLRITKYADRMLECLEKLDWPTSIKESQKNWIGRSEGAEIDFKIVGTEKIITVFTTRPDTLFGATYCVLAPEHKLLDELKSSISNWKEVAVYREEVKLRTEIERTAEGREKTGIELKGVKVVNPANGEELPLYIADYVLNNYGTGVVMAVPAHDERDFAFAKKFNLPVRQVVAPVFVDKVNPPKAGDEDTIRHGVIVMVKHWSEDKYLIDYSPKFNWKCLFTGGIDENEDPLVAAAREMREETGYQNVKEIHYIPLEHIDKFNAPHKGVNRVAHQKNIFIQLADGETKERIEEEKELHHISWLTREEMIKTISLPNHLYIFQTELAGGQPIVDDGVLINSGDFSDVSSEDAKKKITDFVKGRWVTKYRLKDWVFSRQRYWGEPIPVIHCEQCRKSVEGSAYSVNFYEQETWTRLVGGNKIVETRALNPEEKDRYFGGIKEGQYLKAINKLTDEWAYFEVLVVKQYKNFKEFFADKDFLTKSYAPLPIPQTAKELESDYAYTPDYVERINKNGLVAWEVKRVLPGVVPVPEKDLPVVLPQVESYAPTGTGESPLADIAEWVNVPCPKCGGMGKRETNTMPQWAGSSWYYLRFIDPKNSQTLVDKEKEKYWSPIDMYVGGAEHATRHLIYARFYHKFLYDIGVVNYEEPFARLQNVGLIMAEDGRKMSKRWGNVVNPDDIVNEYGADTLRLYEMFMGPFGQAVAWSTKSIVGPYRFIERVWRLQEKVSKTGGEHVAETTLHKTIKKVGDDIEVFGFNTAISSLMILLNEFEKLETIPKNAYETLLILLAPFAPHITEEIFHELGNKNSIHLESWPSYDESKCVESEMTIAIQVNGKVRDTITVPRDTEEEVLRGMVLALPSVQKWVEGKIIEKIIVIPERLVSIVVKE